MITQIYETSTREEARELLALGVDHIGVLVGDGSFPREHTVEAAGEILAAIRPPAKSSLLFLSANSDLIVAFAARLRPDIVHLGAAPDLLGAEETRRIGRELTGVAIMRSVPVVNEDAIEIARSYEAAADLLLLDSHAPGDKQIGALGVPHDWDISRRIVEEVAVPVILAGGLGPHNVAEAITRVRPAGVDSKTKTDVPGTHRKDLARVAEFVAAVRLPAN